MSIVLTRDNIQDELKVGDFVKVNDSKYSKVTYLYWKDLECDLGFKVKDKICQGTNIVADSNVRNIRHFHIVKQ